MRTLSELLRRDGVSPADILFLRCDTAIPSSGLALLHTRMGVSGRDVYMKLPGQAEVNLSHTGLDPRDLMDVTVPHDEAYRHLKHEVDAARLVVTYRWRPVRGFSQRNVIRSLFDFESRFEFEPWPVLDVFDVERLWRGGKTVSAASVEEACAATATGSPGGPVIGSLGDVMGTLHSQSYELRGAHEMMWGLVEVFKKQSEDYAMYEPRGDRRCPSK